jgi:hypothetical protein
VWSCTELRLRRCCVLLLCVLRGGGGRVCHLYPHPLNQSTRFAACVVHLCRCRHFICAARESGRPAELRVFWVVVCEACAAQKRGMVGTSRKVPLSRRYEYIGG